MNAQAESCKRTDHLERSVRAPALRPGNRWFAWAGRHPGVILLGAVAVAVLAIPKPTRKHNVESDSAGEEVPLFI